MQQYNEFNKGIIQKRILKVILKIVKHLILIDYYLNLQIT